VDNIALVQDHRQLYNPEFAEKHNYKLDVVCLTF